ncbi:MAG: hypothetical protein V4556_14100 [Bacteroidota bacterium]
MILISLFFSNTIYAFSTKGHVAIEKVALKLLRQSPNGGAITDSLISWGFLKDDGRPHSQYTDFSFERQFSQNRQMFHFMSSNDAVMNAIRAKPANIQQAVLINTLEGCLQMMYFFFREIIECPAGASQSGRGTYVLMHIISDSYSEEHTIRDSATMDLITIKGWKPSRLWWPAVAKQKEEGKESLLLLHKGFFAAKGDSDWKGDKEGLSPLAMQAAIAIKDMLLLLYNANGKSSQADALIRIFFEYHYRPFQAVATSTEFILPGSAGKIPYSFLKEYGNDSSRNDILFQYDRYPRLVYMFTTQMGFSHKQFFNGYGLEMSTYRSPGAADNSRALFTLLPLGIGGSLSKMIIKDDNRSYFSSVRLKGFTGALIALPLINASLNPYGGVAAFPFSNTTSLSALYGVDITWNFANNWGRSGRNTKTFRLSLGYEHDNWGQSFLHTYKIKVGFNTWQGRRTTCPKRKSSRIKTDPEKKQATSVKQEN